MYISNITLNLVLATYQNLLGPASVQSQYYVCPFACCLACVAVDEKDSGSFKRSKSEGRPKKSKKKSKEKACKLCARHTAVYGS